MYPAPPFWGVSAFLLEDRVWDDNEGVWLSRVVIFGFRASGRLVCPLWAQRFLGREASGLHNTAEGVVSSALVPATPDMTTRCQQEQAMHELKKSTEPPTCLRTSRDKKDREARSCVMRRRLARVTSRPNVPPRERSAAGCGPHFAWLSIPAAWPWICRA